MKNVLVLALLLGSLNFAYAQEWMQNPSFEYMNEDKNRDACFDRELKAQWPQAAQEKTFWTVPLANENGNSFDTVILSFCIEDHAKPGYCGHAYEVALGTSQSKGWTVDFDRSDMRHYFVKAKDVARFAPVTDRKTGEIVLSLDLFNCRSFLGIH